MSSTAESSEFDVGQTVVLNALIDMFAEETIVLDSDSEHLLREEVTEVTSSGERSFVREELDRLSELEVGESADIDQELNRFVENVADRLAEKEYSISVSHEYQQQISPVDAHVYSYIHTGDIQRLQALDLSPAVKNALEEGADLLETDAKEEAQSKFSEAVDQSTEPTEKVVSRIIAGWGYFRSGDDDTALEYVQDALELEESSWAAKVVGASVKRDESGYIRSGQKSVGILLRWVVSDSENTSTQAEVGGRSNGNPITWEEVNHVEDHGFIDQVYPETWIRFNLQGKLPDFPNFEVYFLGLGVYDNKMGYIDNVIERFGSGPHNTGSVERITIER